MSGPQVNLQNMNPQQLEQLIQKTLQNRNYPLAEQACVKLKQLRPDYPMPCWILAQIHGSRGNHQQSIHYLKTCVSLKPEKIESLFLCKNETSQAA